MRGRFRHGATGRRGEGGRGSQRGLGGIRVGDREVEYKGGGKPSQVEGGYWRSD